MADIYSKEERSKRMSLIKGKNTKPEMVVRKFLHSEGFRYRLHSKNLPSKPDLVLPKYNTVIFINGCFWHGHEDDTCKIARIPKSNVEFWLNKINYNKSRDKKNIQELITNGWHVLTIWECQLRGKARAETLEELVNKIHSFKS